MTRIEPETVEVKLGGIYPFYSEVQEEYKPSEERLRRFTGTLVEVIAEAHEGDEGSLTYRVRAHDGTEFDAHPEEILLGSAPPLLCDHDERLARLAAAGVQRVLLWPVGDEVRQIERFVRDVRPLVGDVR